MSSFPILRYFAFEHLPPQLQEISKPFHDLAHEIAQRAESTATADRAETAAALRKLKEAKDCAVCAGLTK